MDIKVLGTGCANCKNTIALIDLVAQAKGVTVKLENGATVKNYAYFYTADAIEPDLLTDKNMTTHNYMPGDYQARVTVTFNGVATGTDSSDCAVKINVEQPCEFDHRLPANSPKCVKPGCVDNPVTEKDECHPTPPTPPVTV